DRNRSHWSTSKTPSYTKSVSWQHHPHAIENPGKIPLEIIEVRSGVYLEEDDVIRVSSSGVGY
ncbi:hypothetical protein, partial [Escherichia coli]|uniref:hypothetical protein n=1 Tax=Escherichia coli TaxID=562 RepID=UPI0021C5F577